MEIDVGIILPAVDTEASIGGLVVKIQVMAKHLETFFIQPRSVVPRHAGCCMDHLVEDLVVGSVCHQSASSIFVPQAQVGSPKSIHFRLVRAIHPQSGQSSLSIRVP